MFLQNANLTYKRYSPVLELLEITGPRSRLDGTSGLLD